MAKRFQIEVFTPPNVLKARVGGGSALDLAAIERAEGAMEALSGKFEAWMRHDVEVLDTARLHYAKTPCTATLASIFRAAHDLKGQANSFNAPPLVARVATSLCALLERSEPGHTQPLVLINAHVDTIKIILQSNIGNARDQTASLLAAELEAKVTALLGPQPQSQSATR